VLTLILINLVLFRLVFQKIALLKALEFEPQAI